MKFPFPSAPYWRLYVPKLVTVMRQGYGWADLRQDVLAGLTVAVVALPLAMALAIASGTSPDKGLVTAIVAGFLISALGGSRFQIGGPTGAFVVVVFNVIDKFGYDGLVVATLMAGAMLVISGFARLGTVIKYIPQPVITGFTAGIAVIIFSSQVGEFFGLQLEKVPADFLEKWQVYAANWEAYSGVTLGVAALSLALIVALRKLSPKLPAFLLTVLLGSVLVWAFGLQTETIGTRFGGITAALPVPAIPEFTLFRLKELLPSAFTIAFLAGVESLLSAVVADAVTARRHRSNCELVAQGVANMASALFGGLPATGAIARTMTNIRSGARSPIAGIMHAVFLLVFIVVAAPLAAYIPLASLAAVLMIVAWNMSEVERIRSLLRATWGERMTLLVTFGLTVLVDLTVAIEAGVVMAAILFMVRMTRVVEIQSQGQYGDADMDDFTRQADPYMRRGALPPGVELLQIRGPFFFGATGRLLDALDDMAAPARIYLLDLQYVPFIDATGAHALSDFVGRVRRQGGHVIIFGLQQQPLSMIDRMQVAEGQDNIDLVGTYENARDRAGILLKA